MRRSLFIFLIAALLVFAIYRWQRLDHSMHGGGRAERYTPASGPKIDLKDVQVLAALDSEYTRLVDAVVPSVVSIATSRHVQVPQPAGNNPLDMFFRNRRLLQAPRERIQTALGSGVIVSKEGHILTNRHVIAQMEKIEVQLTDGRVEPATLIGADEQTDIAVLKIEAKNVEPLAFGDSDQVRVGQLVFAIGNPFGLQETVTQGIVSAKGRRAVADSGVEFFQTDAAVNQGNSGGPLLNLRGEIIGINSAIYSTSDEGAWLGISFAIPSNVARRALDSLLKNGRIIRGYLGVNMMDITPFIARQLGLSDTAGALVGDVMPGSPAEKAGVQPGDVIQRFNGRPVTDTRALRTRVAETDIGGAAELTILRKGQEITLTATVSEAPVTAPPIAPRPSAPGKP
jgi:serine protease Do